MTGGRSTVQLPSCSRIWVWTHLLPTLSGVTFLEAAEEGEEAADEVVEEVMMAGYSAPVHWHRTNDALTLPLADAWPCVVGIVVVWSVARGCVVIARASRLQLAAAGSEARMMMVGGSSHQYHNVGVCSIRCPAIIGIGYSRRPNQSIKAVNGQRALIGGCVGRVLPIDCWAR